MALAYALLCAAMPKVPALTASLLLLLEPALNPIWTWLVHGEQPAPLALVGGVVILGATTAGAVLGPRAPQPAPPAPSQFSSVRKDPTDAEQAPAGRAD